MRINYHKWTREEEARLKSIWAKYQGRARREKLRGAFPDLSLSQCKDKAFRMGINKPPIRWTLEKLNRIARQYGGVCLEHKFLGCNHKHRFRCAKRHKFLRRPSDLYLEKNWCDKCRIAARNIKKLEKLKNAALEVGLICLEPLWLGVHEKHRFNCMAEGHRTSKVPTTVINHPTGCPHCSTGLGERICRIYFETLWGKEFLKCRPRSLSE